jgi:hypothetical protein
MTTLYSVKQWLFRFLRGNALARIVYDASGNPIETIFINWDKVTDIRINKGELLYVQGFTNPLLASEVLHFKNFSRRNRRRGRNNLWRTAIRIAMRCKTSATNFENKGVRQGVISVR